MRVLAALSGGVDSAVAAARAVEAGHDVVGVHMALSRTPAQHRTGSRGCCSVEDASDARRAADILGIPYYVWDLSEDFHETVVKDFLSEYEKGRTPNPCVRCNEHVKFASLMERAIALGFDGVVTGHYAGIVEVDGRRELHRAADPFKDQSYVLAVMGVDRLARSIFPLGDVPTKAEVRAEADARGLGVSNKPDSYDICFVADGNTQGFLQSHLGERPGEIFDTDGQKVGEHSGAYAFTIGQRKGLDLNKPAADGKPRYVVSTDPVANKIIVGPSAMLTVDKIECDQTVWLADDVTDLSEVGVQVRAHGEEIPARVERDGDHLVAYLERGIRGVAGGQSLVVYSGTRVLGQASIMKASRINPQPAATQVSAGV